MTIPAKRFENSTFQKDLNLLIDEVAGIIAGGAHSAATLGASNDSLLTLSGQTFTLSTLTLSLAKHAAIGDSAPHHAAVTLGAGNDGLLTSSGQEITLSTNTLSTAKHAAIGDSSPHHAAATAGTGITVTGQQVAIDQTVSPTWTGDHTFQGDLVTRHVTPETSNTYDIGTTLNLYRKAFIAELDAVILAENTRALVGGWLVVGPGEGKLVVDATDVQTTMSFGQAMTVGDFVLFRSLGQVEYVQVGSAITGAPWYTYNVTRDLDGTGGNAWPAGSVYEIQGHSGQGRIELNAYDTPRISILKQGATYDAATEVTRIGDLNGSFGIASELYGVGVGDYAGGNYLRYDPTNGLVLSGIDGKFQITSAGIGMLSSQTLKWSASTTFDDPANFGLTIGTDDNGYAITATGGALLTLEGSGTSVNVLGRLNLPCTLYRGSDSTLGPASIFVPLATPATSTSYDGDAVNAGSYTLDTSSLFGLPANIKAVAARIAGKWGSTGDNVYLRAGETSAHGNALVISPFDANVRCYGSGIIPCDSNGDFVIVINGANTTLLDIQIYGYFI